MPVVTLQGFELTRDGALLLGWLQRPHVAKWWGDSARAMQHASACAPESHALIVADGMPVGYVCWQQLPAEELEDADLKDVPGGLMDIDILLGDPDLLGQGIGTQALRLLLTRLRSEQMVGFAGLGTSTSNTRAIRCYEKAGFQLHRMFQDPEWGPCHYLIAAVRGSV